MKIVKIINDLQLITMSRTIYDYEEESGKSRYRISGTSAVSGRRRLSGALGDADLFLRTPVVAERPVSKYLSFSLRFLNCPPVMAKPRGRARPPLFPSTP